MKYRQRQLIATIILIVSFILVVYLIFFTPSRQTIEVETPTTTSDETEQRPTRELPTRLPSSPETESKRTVEAADAARDLVTPVDIPVGTVVAIERDMATIPDWMSAIPAEPSNDVCPDTATREVQVSTNDQLTAALADAHPGDRIVLEPGRYIGNFSIQTSGETGQRIWICGSPQAEISTGDISGGTALTIDGDLIGVWGLTIAQATDGIVVDGGNGVILDNIEIHTIGKTGIQFTNDSTDGMVQESRIHHTGLLEPILGQGIVVGSPISSWSERDSGEPDRSGRIRIARNQIWDTSAESIVLYEGTTTGSIEFNSLDGAAMSAADSWIDIRGNDYVLRGNVGATSPGDGFQTHRVEGADSGSNNQFIGNTAQVRSQGYGFYIHEPETTNNIVLCNNTVRQAAAGFSNIPCVEQD